VVGQCVHALEDFPGDLRCCMPNTQCVASDLLPVLANNVPADRVFHCATLDRLRGPTPCRASELCCITHLPVALGATLAGGFVCRNRGITPDLNGSDIGRACLGCASAVCRNTENVKAAVEADEEEEKKKHKAAAGAWNGRALPPTTIRRPPIFGRRCACGATQRARTRLQCAAAGGVDLVVGARLPAPVCCM